LSGALARALETFYGGKAASIAAQLGYLYETVREANRASDYFLLAAQSAQRIFANQEAIALARRGLALLERVPDTPERANRNNDAGHFRRLHPAGLYQLSLTVVSRTDRILVFIDLLMFAS
jgi:hypothetical protein